MILVFLCVVTVFNNIFNVECIDDFLGIEFDEVLWQCILHDLTLLVLGFASVLMIKDGHRRSCCYITRKGLVFNITRQRVEKMKGNDITAPLMVQLTDSTINTTMSNSVNITVFNPNTITPFKKTET